VIDVRVLREDPERVRASQRDKGGDVALVDRALSADEDRRRAIASFESLRSEQKALGKQISAAASIDRPALLAQAKDLAGQVKAAEASAASAERSFVQATWSLDNLLDDRAPRGGEEDFVTLATVGTPRDFESEGFQTRDHLDLGAALGAIDTERAAKVSGSRFFYLTGPGALLELALVNLGVQAASGWGFTPVIPPVLVRPEAMAGTGFLGQAADDVFRLPEDDLYLVGTSEVPLAAMHSQEILDAADLPLRYAAFSPCFRREAGSYGKDTRGIIRVHQFDKVEMFSFCRPDDAAEEHERLLSWQRQFFDQLDVPYRVIDVAGEDLGAAAARKFDIEAWIPSQGRYREVTSTSNCTTYQARRLGTRMRDTGSTTDTKPQPVATLNGTLVAIPRTIVAILENHQQADGSVTIPDALRPHMMGLSSIQPAS
jgi:seryl-tRNA synthetase